MWWAFTVYQALYTLSTLDTPWLMTWNKMVQPQEYCGKTETRIQVHLGSESSFLITTHSSPSRGFISYMHTLQLLRETSHFNTGENRVNIPMRNQIKRLPCSFLVLLLWLQLFQVVVRESEPTPSFKNKNKVSFFKKIYYQFQYRATSSNAK